MYYRSWATMEEYIKTDGSLWRNTLTYLSHVTTSGSQSDKLLHSFLTFL